MYSIYENWLSKIIIKIELKSQSNFIYMYSSSQAQLPRNLNKALVIIASGRGKMSHNKKFFFSSVIFYLT